MKNNSRSLKSFQALYEERASIKDQQDQQGTNSRPDSRGSSSSDPMIFPGLYSPSGFDVLQILFQVQRRPNPTYTLGNIDSGVALLEILGKNCRFLQQPYDPNTFEILGNAPAAMSIPNINNSPTIRAIQNTNNDPNSFAKPAIRKALEYNLEAQVTLVNYRKSGERFLNVLTTVPIKWTTSAGEEKNYVVGFQAVAPPRFRTPSS
ncbi:hypothetical protein DID88_004456 [Monilinia fructigena]|uniref:Uncharacterized protein n=1 Tax=Monilinia fructigena TaxID=38457 RepID=A0A395IW89_9HELO|nr:hypothetical protein DID88_004456 [Monilinia fructigena]